MDTTLNKLEKQIKRHYNIARKDYMKAGGDPQSPRCPESAKVYKKSWLAWESSMRSLTELRSAISKANGADIELIANLQPAK